MAVTYGFYNALNHDRVYDALQMSSIFDGIIQNGVFSTIGEALICKASGTGLIVNVGSGRAWFDHTWTLNDTDYPVEAEQAEVVLDRIDAIVLEVNQAVEVRANSIKFVKGTPSSTPVRPTMIHNAEVNQYALAYVNVRAGQTTIFDSDITNVVGTDETPFVTGLLQQLSVEQLLLQWNDDFYRYFNNFKTVSTADFNTFMTTKQTEYAAWYANMQAEGAADLAEFDAWFQHMKDQLDEDAAGHLQAEIDALAEQAEKGSIIRVTTSESTLINQTCTITQDLLSRTAIFDSHGVADFPSVPMIGDMVITSTDGTMTAIRNVNIPYFGRYEFEIAFWSATLAIHTSSSDLYGRPITIKQGTTTIGTTAFNQQGVASFDVHSAGTYTVSAVTTGGTESKADVVVTEETTYNVELDSVPEGATVTPTDVISTWIACAGLENSHNYTTITEVMADTELFDTLLRDSNACDYMARSTTWANPGLVPTMTSDTTPEGVASAGSVYPGSSAYLAFDNDSNTEWYGNLITNVNASATDYLQYQFSQAKIVKAIKFVDDVNVETSSITLKGSNDGSNFTLIGTYTSGLDNEFIVIDNNTAYSYIRAEITQINHYTAQARLPQVIKLQFYANADVSIVDDHDAMTHIGLYDYCSEKLLSNATWAEAIAESEYWEEICDISVPTMTSATTPSGTVISSGDYSTTYSAWKAFDKNDSTNWASTSPAVANTTYVGYKFTSAVKIQCLKIKQHATNYLKKYKVQGSNDSFSSDIHDLTDTITETNAGNTSIIPIPYTANYSDYRLLCMEPSVANDNVSISTLQFYGRHSNDQPTTQIHSCPNDTIYHMANGSPVVLATTDANGVGEVNWDNLPAGDLTLYSSVAKDPDNLSNDYHKVCTITKTAYGHTTDFYLMPDLVKTLYWWGYESKNLEDCTTANGWTGTNTQPIHNTNDVTLSGGASAIGSKTTISATKGYSVYQVTGGRGYLETVSGKNFNNVVNYVNADSTSQAKVELTITASNYLTMFVEAAAPTVKVYALWHE